MDVIFFEKVDHRAMRDVEKGAVRDIDSNPGRPDIDP